jgi:hypothetical protein
MEERKPLKAELDHHGKLIVESNKFFGAVSRGKNGSWLDRFFDARIIAKCLFK